MEAKYTEAATAIADRIKAGESVSAADRKFLNSFLAISGKPAGNAGKRKTVCTGR